MFRKKHKNFKAIWAVLGHSKTKIFSVGQPWRPTFFQDLGPPNYFSVATALALKRWLYACFGQNVKYEKIITSTESKKQGASKNIFQCIEEDLQKFQEAGGRDVNLNRFCENGEIFPDNCILNHANFYKKTSK